MSLERFDYVITGGDFNFVSIIGDKESWVGYTAEKTLFSQTLFKASKTQEIYRKACHVGNGWDIAQPNFLARDHCLGLVARNDLLDVWRGRNQHKIDFTWRSKATPAIHCR